MIRVAIVTNLIPHYRRDFYRRLLSCNSMEVSVFCQTLIRGMNLASIHEDLAREFPGRINTMKCRALKSERLAWQELPVRTLWTDFNIVVFYGNPRLLSTVLWASIFRLAGKKIVIWGQAHTANANAITERLRLNWWRLFRTIVTYTDCEANQLVKKGFTQQVVIGINNGLDQKEIDAQIKSWNDQDLAAWQAQNALKNKRVLLSVARLVAKNEFPALIENFKSVVSDHPDVLWIIVGDGPDYEKISLQVQEHNLTEHVRLLGAIYDEAELAPWFLTSSALIHPGAIGLTLLHAYGYGLPVITHDAVHLHMPEIAAFKHAENGLEYSYGSLKGLSHAIKTLFCSEEMRRTLGKNAQKVAREQYNTEAMAERMQSAIKCAR